MRAALPRVLPVALLLVAITVLTVWIMADVGIVTPQRRPSYTALHGACWILFGAACLLVKRVPDRLVPAIVTIGAVVIGLAALTGQPNTSTDSARYNWDGIVQNAGISPYRYVPTDTALQPLRPQWLFPDGTPTDSGGLRCPGLRARPAEQVGAPGLVCTAINRPTVPTIYPPVAEALFAVARFFVPRAVAYSPTQVLGLVAVVATTLLLLRTLRSLDRDPRWAAAFAWCPFVTMEAIGNAHIDGSAAFFALAGTVLAVRGRALGAGALIGLGIATKFLPVLVVPPLLKRHPVRLAGAAVAVVVAVYVPHLIAAGDAVIGYLPGYLDEEGYDGGSRSALLSAVLPDTAATVGAAVLLLALAVVVLLRADPADPWAAQVLVIGGALVLASPRYAWYALLLVPFMAMSGRWEWFAAVILFSIPVIAGQPVPFRVGLLLVVVVVVTAGVLRRRRSLRTD
ncbi:glycosyltransferase 87 family protein [Amnibacterium endophyticum]|uniref:Glycosyltransferase 87 family protein n=1 Tax=Amnibacterium endophyticum TaxID=2109337 RepID=A0ABW4LHS7_9MICO